METIPYSSRRDIIAGAAAGFFGGLLLGWALHSQGLPSASGRPTVWATLGPLLIHCLSGALGGVAFAAVFRYERESPASSASGGLLFGLLAWILGPLTLMPLWNGHAPSWSGFEAGAAFPSLIGYVLYGGVLGISFYTLMGLHAQLHPSATTTRPLRPDLVRDVVILGGGFGGVSAAQRLEQLLTHHRHIKVTLVSQSNYLLFTPMLAGVAGSELDAHHIGAPLRAALPRTRVRRADVEAIDTHRRLVWVRSTAAGLRQALEYDHLVLALGSVPHYHGQDGLEAHALPLKTLEDAIRLRNHVITALESADEESREEVRPGYLTFVVAGGGFAGTEIVTELFDLVRSVRRFYRRVRPQDPRFILVHSGDRILPELSPRLATYVLRRLRARGIVVLLNSRVIEATPSSVVLKDGQRLPTRTLVWTAGNHAHPLLSTLPCDRNGAGAVIDTPTLEIKGLVNVWGIGDCAEIPDLSSGGLPCPPTAQHAVRQGAAVAENVFATLRGKPARPFRFRTMGVLLGLGHHSAVAELRGWRFSGPLAWFVWRTVYLSKLPGIEKKIRVALDWTVDLFFPRDFVVAAESEPERQSPPVWKRGEARDLSTMADPDHVREQV